MPGLTASLLNAMNALLAQQGALNATTNNIANVNTPGYSRQVPIFEEATPTYSAAILWGNGVHLKGFQSIRDQLLELRIQQQTQQQSGAEARSTALQQIEPLFLSTGSDIGSKMSAFFSSLSRLSPDPANPSFRQGVLAAGQDLANAFHVVAAGVSQVTVGLNRQVSQDVQQINHLAEQIAGLQEQYLVLSSSGQEAGTIKDQINELTRQLSEVTDIQVTQSETGDVLSTAGGTPLVVGTKSYALHTTTLPNGRIQVVAPSGQDLTALFKNGDLGGTLQIRDQVLPDLMEQLDTFAFQFANTFNAVQNAGYDLTGGHGPNFFSVPGTATGAAQGISVAITDPARIAASEDGSTGDNGNLTDLLALQYAPLPSGISPTDTYSGLVFSVGALTSSAKAEADALDSSVQQLQDQRSAISGVSIDEEATNMIRYQRAYEAAAKVISVVDELTQVAINMI